MNLSQKANRVGRLFGSLPSIYQDASNKALNSGLKQAKTFSDIQRNNQQNRNDQFNQQQFEKGLQGGFNFAQPQQVDSFRNFRKTGNFNAGSFSQPEIQKIKSNSPLFNRPEGRKLFLPQPEQTGPSIKNASMAGGTVTNANIPVPLSKQYKPELINMFGGEDKFSQLLAGDDDTKLQAVINARKLQPNYVNDQFVQNFDRVSNRNNLARLSRGKVNLSGVAAVERAENPQIPKGAADALAFSYLGNVDPNKPEEARKALGQYLGIIGQNQQPQQSNGFRRVDQFFQDQADKAQPTINPNAQIDGQTFAQDPVGFAKNWAGKGVNVLLDKIDSLSDYFSTSGITANPSQQEAFNSLISEAIKQGVPLEMRNGAIMVKDQTLDQYLKDQIQNVETQSGNPQEDIREQFERLQKEGVIPNSSDGLASLQVGEQRPFNRNGQPGVVSRNSEGKLIFKANKGNKWIELPES